MPVGVEAECQPWRTLRGNGHLCFPALLLLHLQPCSWILQSHHSEEAPRKVQPVLGLLGGEGQLPQPSPD